MKFFDLENNSISAEDFVKIYSSIYLYNLKPNDKELEKKVVKILKNRQTSKPKPLSTEDIIHILCWKTFGKCEDGYIKHFKGQQICVSKVEDCIDKNKSYKYKEDDGDITELLTDLMKVKGIGPVYAITMLYFLSGGEYPIYDKFAHIAVTWILKGKKPENIITSNMSKKYFKIYNKYQIDIANIFGKEAYEKDRNIDRALWIYGKLISGDKWFRL